eukprot:1661226-Amphidinium_carterae.3
MLAPHDPEDAVLHMAGSEWTCSMQRTPGDRLLQEHPVRDCGRQQCIPQSDARADHCTHTAEGRQEGFSAQSVSTSPGGLQASRLLPAREQVTVPKVVHMQDVLGEVAEKSGRSLHPGVDGTSNEFKTSGIGGTSNEFKT